MEEINSTINSSASTVGPVPSVTESHSSFKIPWVAVFVVGMMVLSSLVTYLILKSPAPVKNPASVAQSSPAVVVQPTPTPDPTANWKTWTNTKYKYSFKYPSQWFLDPNSDSPLLSDVPFPTMGYPDYIIGIVVDIPFSDRLNIDVPIGTKKEVGTKVYEEKIADLIIDGHKAAKFNTTVLAGSPTDAHNGNEIKIEDANKYIYVEHWQNLPRKTTGEMNNIFDQILSTFKFLE